MVRNTLSSKLILTLYIKMLKKSSIERKKNSFFYRDLYRAFFSETYAELFYPHLTSIEK